MIVASLTIFLLLQIFSTGRSLNYISFACADASWVSAQQQEGPLSPTSMTQSSASQAPLSNDTPQKLRYNDINGLERSIDAAYSAASRRLFEIFFDKFGLLRHLRAIKDYLLLGRGDFVDLLMENMKWAVYLYTSSVHQANASLLSLQHILIQAREQPLSTHSYCDSRKFSARVIFLFGPSGRSSSARCAHARISARRNRLGSLYTRI